MIRHIRFLGFLPVLLLAAAATSASAQTVHGTLRAEEPDRPIPRAQLLLLDADGVAIDSTRTDGSGAFRLTAPVAGSYTLYFRMDGWAGVPSPALELAAGTSTRHDFRVPLIANAAIREMSDIMQTETWLQESLPEICGEPFRAWEAGLLIGVVRVRASREPIAGARVSVLDESGAIARSSISTASGVYVLCNVPLGAAVPIRVETPGGEMENTDAEIRPGTASWYDLPVGPRRR